MDRYADTEQDAQLESFAEELGLAFPEESTAHLEARHVAAMMHAVTLMAEKGEPVARPASKTNGPDRVSGLPKPGRVSQMYEKLFATRAAKVATITGALLLAFSGVAIASGFGVLPSPVQNVVANGVAPLGIDLPGGDDEVAERDAEEAAAAQEAQKGAAEKAIEAAQDAQEKAAEKASEDAEKAGEAQEDSDDRDERAREESDDRDDKAREAEDREEEANEDSDDRDETATEADDRDEDANEDSDDRDEETATHSEGREENVDSDDREIEEED